MGSDIVLTYVLLLFPLAQQPKMCLLGLRIEITSLYSVLFRPSPIKTWSSRRFPFTASLPIPEATNWSPISGVTQKSFLRVSILTHSLQTAEPAKSMDFSFQAFLHLAGRLADRVQRKEISLEFFVDILFSTSKSGKQYFLLFTRKIPADGFLFSITIIKLNLLCACAQKTVQTSLKSIYL